jgi:hypothetical protein
MGIEVLVRHERGLVGRRERKEGSPQWLLQWGTEGKATHLFSRKTEYRCWFPEIIYNSREFNLSCNYFLT